MNETTNDNTSSIDNIRFAITVITTIMEEDPTKIIDCLEDAEGMIASDAAMGATKVEMMGEAAIHFFKSQNAGNVPELIEVIDKHYVQVEAGIIAFFIEKGY